MHSTRGFVFQTTISCLYMALEYLEVLNIYNCERWWCGRTSFAALTVLGLNAAVFRENIALSIPVIIAHAMTAAAIVLWCIEYDFIFNHLIRTEYYDTHALSFAVVFIANQLAIYRFLDKQHEKSLHETIVSNILLATEEEEDIKVNASAKLSQSTLASPPTLWIKNEPFDE
ncbi:hypothetical protein DIPPA_53368 [Diplonema papillatum]|nr:hypothetical protein DIPPA_53368 [Diplonema papillatum]|eukprot:gene11051-16983_t